MCDAKFQAIGKFNRLCKPCKQIIKNMSPDQDHVRMKK